MSRLENSSSSPWPCLWFWSGFRLPSEPFSCSTTCSSFATRRSPSSSRGALPLAGSCSSAPVRGSMRAGASSLHLARSISACWMPFWAQPRRRRRGSHGPARRGRRLDHGRRTRGPRVPGHPRPPAAARGRGARGRLRGRDVPSRRARGRTKSSTGNRRWSSTRTGIPSPARLLPKARSIESSSTPRRPAFESRRQPRPLMRHVSRVTRKRSHAEGLSG